MADMGLSASYTEYYLPNYMDKDTMEIVKGLIYAIIPARSGSTSVKNKNIRPVHNHPLLAYSIGAAKLTPEICRTIVTTDSEEYAKIARFYGAETPFLRPAEISGKYSTDLEFMDHAISWFTKEEGRLPEYWVHLRPTTPLRDPQLISDAINKIKNNPDATALRSSHRTEFCPFKWFKVKEDGYYETFDGLTPDQANGPRQKYPVTYIPDGYVDVIKTEQVLEGHTLHGNNVLCFEVPPVIDIDNPEEMAEVIRQASHLENPLKNWLDEHKSISSNPQLIENHLNVNKLEKYIVNGKCNLLDALSYMEKYSIKYMLVADESKKIIGTMTDGDIRRSIIHNHILTEPVEDVCNKNFKFIYNSASFKEIIHIFKERKYGFLPILNDQGHLVNLITPEIAKLLLLTNKTQSIDFDFEELNNTPLEYEMAYKPWGYYKTMVLNEMFQSKVIYILPNQSISLQSHKKREEHWTIITGQGKVQLDEKIYPVHPGDTIDISVGQKHRIINTSEKDMLIFSEIQLGDYFGEDDIQRYDDQYGRINT